MECKDPNKRNCYLKTTSIADDYQTTRYTSDIVSKNTIAKNAFNNKKKHLFKKGQKTTDEGVHLECCIVWQ